jgi:CheY-like chemotaxis protein
VAKDEGEFNVLVIDDDENVGYLFEQLLGGPQEVTVAADGYEAIEKAQQKPFDLIFIDVRLPGIDGVETLKRLREITPDAVMVMMSGHEVSREVREAFLLGA